MGRRIDAVKAHLTKHKWYYISAGLVVGTAGITCLIMRGSQGRCLAVATNELPRSTMESGPLSFGVRDINDSFNVINNFGGYQSKLVQNDSTGEIYRTITEAAAKAGVSFSKMSRHLNGHMDHVDGVTYSIVGLGTI